MGGGEGVVHSTSGRVETRLDVAREVIRDALDKLSVDGDNRVGLVLFGHRLAWQQGVSEPDLLEQTRYLEQTLGFEVLKDLLPGDDVEIVRHVGRFEPQDLVKLETNLNALQPWGEDPLYLALQKSIDTFERPGQSERRIIVITDGGNSQGMAKQKIAKEQVFESIDRRPVPVYIFRIGDDDIGRQAESEMGQIARRSGGDYLKAANAEELRKHLHMALAVHATRPAKLERTNQTQNTEHGGDETTAEMIKSAVATIKTSTPAPEEIKTARLQGSVSYYGIPAKRAKIILEGDANQVVARTDSQGNFSIEDVEPGTYTLSTEATVKNTFRYASRKLRVDNSGRAKTIDLILE